MDPISQDSAGSPIVPTGDQIYDSIMAKIEPELLSANIPTLDDAYVGESEQERAVRYLRYSEAFAKYDEAYAEWERQLNEAVTNYRKTALQSAEAMSRTEDGDALARLERDFEGGAAAPNVQLAA